MRLYDNITLMSIKISNKLIKTAHNINRKPREYMYLSTNIKKFKKTIDKPFLNCYNSKGRLATTKSDGSRV